MGEGNKDEEERKVTDGERQQWKSKEEAAHCVFYSVATIQHRSAPPVGSPGSNRPQSLHQGLRQTKDQH